MKKALYLALSASLAALSAPSLLADLHQPTTASPAPEELSEDVISLFSGTYTNVAVDTLRTEWSVADYEEVSIEGVPTILYTNLDNAGIETVASQIDASGMDHFHIDLWTPNMTEIKIKLVDFGPDGAWGGGDDTEHELTFSGIAQNEWHSLRIPLANFTGLQNQANMAQYILSGNPAGAGTLYVNNIYFSSGGEGDGDGGDNGGTPAEQPPAPDGFVASDTVGETPVNSGEVFLAAGPNNTGSGIVYRLFYSPTASAPSDAKTATEYSFGNTAGDGDGEAAFGFVLGGLMAGTDYTFWLYQYDTTSAIYSESPATASMVSGGTNGGGNGGGTPGPSAPATASPIPTEPSENVISIFSSVYTDVTVDTFRTGWSTANHETVMIDGVPTLLYSNLDVVGIETVASQVDATGMEYFHIDVWSPNMDLIRVKLVDFGPDGAWAGGDDTEHELVFEGLAQGQWHSLKLPLADFTGMQNQANLAQYILSGTPTGAGTLYVDNIYLSGSGAITSPPDHFAGLPIDQHGNIDTGDFLGFIHVSRAPWVYIFALERWVYMVDPGEDALGAWTHFTRPEETQLP